MKANEFPDEVYVQRLMETNGDICLYISESPEDATEADLCKANPGQRVAVYTLNRVVRMVRTVKITESPVAAAEGE